MRWRDAGYAHERTARNPDAGKLLRSGPIVGDVPVNHERRREDVTKESEPRQNRRECPRFRLDLEELDFQKIPRPGALDPHRSRQRMHGSGIHLREVRNSGGAVELSVKSVARLKDDVFSWFDFEIRFDVGMPPVMTSVRLRAQRFASIDFNALHARI